MSSQADRLLSAIDSIQAPPSSSTASQDADAILARASEQIISRFDSQHGGFVGAPKFPQAPILEMQAAIADSNTPEAKAVQTCLDTTLEKMAASGLRDHLDGGFFRYCVDESWTIPHFEKMLYDNAQLLPLYAEAAARNGSENLASAAIGIVNWLNSEMLQENGAYSASIDADADGEEGGFHVWTPDQVREVLPEADYEEFANVYGLKLPPNFEGEAWHLIGNVESESDSEALKNARTALHKKREERIHPTLDRKQLTSWNALTAGGLFRAGRALEKETWIGLAQGVLDFIRSELWDGQRLIAVHNRGTVKIFRIPRRLRFHPFRLAGKSEHPVAQNRPGFRRGPCQQHAGSF